jgi:hypothetical protein
MMSILIDFLLRLRQSHIEQRYMWPRLPDGQIDWVLRKYRWAVKNYGKVDHFMQARRKRQIKERLSYVYTLSHPYTFSLSRKGKTEIVGHRFAGFKNGIAYSKPIVRYKLRTRTTKYCGYVFTEWL